MSDVNISWAPRVVMAGRTFRVPVRAEGPEVELVAGDFRTVASRWSGRDSSVCFHLRAPEWSGDFTLKAHRKGQWAEAKVQVRTLDDLRRPLAFNGATWPRRWPLNKGWHSTKKRQTLQDMPQGGVDEAQVRWWMERTDAEVWAQLPPAEIPKAHFVNVHQGCPKCGTAVFRHGGFYPWKRNHLPNDFRSTCPSCRAVFPSNDLAAGDFTSGPHVDDGYGYFDDEGHIFLFAATYHRDQTRAFSGGIGALTNRLRSGAHDGDVARQLGLMLLRQAVEEVYVSAVPQFRYGPTLGTEQPWNGGQTDWASQPDPIDALFAKGAIHYCIDAPYVCETLALAYDTVWPFLRKDQELAARAQAMGVNVARPADVVGLVEEMFAGLLQCILDRGARSNLPRESQGALAILRGLDRSDAQEVMDWLYDEGPDRLRTFGINDFHPDGTPHEATGGYNSIHYNGLFDMEYHVRAFRSLHPKAYPESRYPSLMDDPRVARVARTPHEITMIGKSFFQYGDGGAAGTNASGRATSSRPGSVLLTADCFHDGLHDETLERAAAYTRDPVVREIRDAVKRRKHRRIGTTVHDAAGIAVLRTGEVPERAAVGIVYGDALHHRHRDLLDTQFYAFGRPFLTDLGYPQSWATAGKWEGHWATHNTVWGVVPGPGGAAGRGRLVRSLFAEGVQILDIEADRWGWDRERKRWYRPGVSYRRLIALVETDGEGVALVDLSRICGGTEHWRVCRGLEGEFETEGFTLTRRGGTPVDPNGVRCAMEGLAHPDYEGPACMDDVAEGRAPAAWNGRWQSRTEPGVHLDLHQVRVSFATELMTARATAVMGKPEESNYEYRTVIWRRRPADAKDVTCVDLVFEPRVGEATLTGARGVPMVEGEVSASGVALTTRGGRKVAIYWSPGSGPEGATRFSDGTTLCGPLAAAVDGRVFGCGAAGMEREGRRWTFEDGRQRGRITGLDRKGCTVDVEGLRNVKAGDRVVINPEGRGHTYLVEGVEVVGVEKIRLKLDVTSLLGYAPVVSADATQVVLGRDLLTRTGDLHRTRLETEGAWAETVEAVNPGSSGWGGDETLLRLDPGQGDAAGVQSLAPGTWVSVVDYVAGDAVLCEPVREGNCA